MTLNNIDMFDIIKECFLKVILFSPKSRKYKVIHMSLDEPDEFKTIDDYWEWFISSEYVYAADKNKIKDVLKDVSSFKNIIYRRKKDNAFIYVALEIHSFSTGCLLVVKDIDSLYRHELPLVINEAQRIDGFTNLFNKKAFTEDLKNFDKGDLAIAYVDINGLKWVNDHCGHADGDALIMRCANILKEEFPQYNIYRVGGDEFAVVAFNEKYRIFSYNMLQLHQKVWTEIFYMTEGKENDDGSTEYFPMISIGSSGDIVEDYKDILIDAERQMYADKQIFYKTFSDYKR